MEKRILIVDNMHPRIIEILQKAKLTVDYKPDWDAKTILEQIHQYFAIILRSKIAIDDTFLSQATALKLIARAGSGMDLIDTDLAKKKNIHLCNAPEGNRDAVAEHTLALILALLNKIINSTIEIRNGIWKREENRGTEIKGKTIAIIGCGFMGTALAKRLKNFQCNIISYDKYKDTLPHSFIKKVSLPYIFEHADIVSLHIPLTHETKFFVDTHFFNSFQKKIFFVNTSRGEIVVEKDLLHSIQSGKVVAAALDVLENEKLNTLTQEQKNTLQELFALPQVIFSPHVAGWTHESYQKISEVIGKKIVAFLQKNNKITPNLQSSM